MNKQEGQSRIEWTDYSYNPISGCRHRCRWHIDSSPHAIKCYAEDVAEGIARKTYPSGFEHHYWHPSRLDEPLKVSTPSKVFVTSMGDLMGSWVPEDQIKAVLQIIQKAHWHQFQILTKASKRLLKFDWPKNAWLGVSMPPDGMMNQSLSMPQKEAYMRVAFEVLAELKAHGHITFVSFEPLSWDVAPLVKADALSWAIIGAASRGATYYQPDKGHLADLLIVLREANVPCFYKGNLRPSIPDALWREEFPAFEQIQPTPEPAQLDLFTPKPLPTPAQIAEQINAERDAEKAQKPTALEKAEIINEALVAAVPLKTDEPPALVYHPYGERAEEQAILVRARQALTDLSGDNAIWKPDFMGVALGIDNAEAVRVLFALSKEGRLEKIEGTLGPKYRPVKRRVIDDSAVRRYIRRRLEVQAGLAA